MNWQEIWDKVVEFFQNNVWNIVGFFATLLVGIILIRVILFVLKRIMRRRKIDEMAVRFIAAAVRLTLAVVLVLLLLAIMGVPITGLTTAFSAAVLAIGMALKEFLANVAAGIILVGSTKYKTGDFVQVNGNEGNIEDINFLFTTIKTPNNTQVTVPNSMMVNSATTNLTAYAIRRVAIDFSIAYESDTELAKKTLLNVMLSCGLVYKDPAPLCRLKTLGDSSITYFLTCYCDSGDYWDVYFYIMDHAFDECKRVGIQFPFPQIELTQKVSVPMESEYGGLPERVEKKRKKEVQKLTMDQLEDMTLREMSEYMKKSNQKRKVEKNDKKAAKAKQKTKQSAQKAAKKQAEKDAKSE